jgi:nucleotide-binding universal stress UspA family protein
MIKDLLLVLNDNPEHPAALNYAASLASARGAHLAGAAIVHDLVVPGTVFETAAAGLLSQFRQQSEAAAAKAIARFEDKCRRDGIAAEAFTLDARLSSAGDILARAARRYDLTIVPQSPPDSDRDSDMFAEAALFNSGRPVLLVPYAHNKTFKPDRIYVAWDGGTAAARSLTDAMPFIERAKAVEVVTVAPDAKTPGAPGTGIARHLARHGINNVEVRNVVADNITVAAKILADASSRDADLIVMGGYGHSRLREFVLGGVTREVLASTSVPVLMSH